MDSYAGFESSVNYRVFQISDGFLIVDQGSGFSLFKLILHMFNNLIHKHEFI